MTRFSCAKRERHGLDDVRELRLRRLDSGRYHVLVRVEQVLHHHHRVVSLLDGLPVEVSSELRKRLSVVVDGDRDVLLRRRELVCDLLVQRVGEAGHGDDSTVPRAEQVYG